MSNDKFYENKKRWRDRERAWRTVLIDSLKEPCVVCGEDDPIVLQFHHIDPSDKKFDVNELKRVFASEEVIREEIAKCACLCANDHIRVERKVIDLTEFL